MFFFIGGIQPKTVTVEERSRMCPSCGLYQARLIRVDHYLSLFFIPLIRVKKGEPVLRCDRCANVVRQAGQGASVCPSCGGSLESNFSFCPHCGKPVR
jgi:ribosomal protein L32